MLWLVQAAVMAAIILPLVALALTVKAVLLPFGLPTFIVGCAVLCVIWLLLAMWIDSRQPPS